MANLPNFKKAYRAALGLAREFIPENEGVQDSLITEESFLAPPFREEGYGLPHFGYSTGENQWVVKRRAGGWFVILQTLPYGSINAGVIALCELNQVPSAIVTLGVEIFIPDFGELKVMTYQPVDPDDKIPSASIERFERLVRAAGFGVSLNPQEIFYQ